MDTYCRANCEWNQGFLSQSTQWAHWGVNFERDQGLLLQSAPWALWGVNCEWYMGSFTGCPVGTVGGEFTKKLKVSFTKYLPGTWVSTFQNYSPCACWVLGGHFVSELTMNSPCVWWVNAPLPPVWELLDEWTWVPAIRLPSSACTWLSGDCGMDAVTGIVGLETAS